MDDDKDRTSMMVYFPNQIDRRFSIGSFIFAMFILPAGIILTAVILALVIRGAGR